MPVPELLHHESRRRQDYRPLTTTVSAQTAAAGLKAIRVDQYRTSALVLLALLVTLAGLHVVLAGPDWWFVLALLVIVLIVTTAAVRRTFGATRQYLPPLFGAALLTAVVTLFFAPQDAILGVIPTPATLADFGALLDEANMSIARQSIPAETIAPILFLLCLGIGAIVIAADFLATTLRTPALAGIPLLVLLAVPSAITVDATDPVVFVLGALAYLALLAPRRSRPSRLAVPLAGIMVVGALVIPLALPDVTPSAGNGQGFSTGVNPVITLGQNLRQDIEHTVLTYNTRSRASEYLKLVNIDNFTGTEWGPSAFTLDRGNSPGSIAAPPGLSADVKTERQITNVSVEGLTSPWLPLPYPASRVTGLQGDWYWDPNGLVVRSPSRTAQNQQYQATSVKIEPTPAQLESAGTTVPPNFGSYLALPPGIPGIVTTTAESVAGQAPSNYQKALLLQDFFRNGSFQYSETAPVADGYDGTSMRVIADFLQARSGYCVHFASAMAVMARVLGIPSRIAIGFLPGTRSRNPADGSDLYTVTSHNLHAWPELYFEGIGWTRFEPTVSRGTLPGYADISAADVPTPVNSTPANALPSAAPGAPAPSAAPRRAPDSTRGVAPTTTETDLTLLWIALVLILLTLVILLPAAARAVLRARRLRSLRTGEAGAILAWREVLDSAEDLGIVVPNTATPRETGTILAAASAVAVAVSSGAAAGGAAGAAAVSALVSAGRTLAAQPVPSAALDRLRHSVERQSYSNATVTVETGSSNTGIAVADVESVLTELRSGASAGRRWRSTLIPRSTWRRLRSALGLSAR